MINRVRNTTLTLMNKENRGFISPAEFNRLINLAQLSIIEENFYHYNRWINMQNNRRSNSEYSDIPKNIREKIDLLAEKDDYFYNPITERFSPANLNIYRIEQVFYKNRIVEEVPKSIINLLEQENYAPPSEQYPCYARYSDDLEVYPKTIQEDVSAFYIRYPKAPKWTFVEVNGNPIFNPSASDFQDLELHPSDEVPVTIKLLSYLGLSIRDSDVVQVSKQEEVDRNNKENQ